MADRVAPLLAERGITFHPGFAAARVDPRARVLHATNGATLPYNLLVLVPPHRGVRAVRDSGLTVPGGWVAVNRETLLVPDQPGIWAVGDCTNLPVAKSGSAAHFQARIVAENVLAALRGHPPDLKYDGKVLSVLETGRHHAALLQFGYRHPPQAGAPSSLTYWANWLFEKAYFQTVPRDRTPM